MSSDRRDAINQIIQSRGEIRLSELETIYPDISAMTLRRDLENLERQGIIVRTRGGAKSIAHLSMLKEAAYPQRQVTFTEAKQIIAQKAISLIAAGQSIYIDSGTTCTIFAQQIPDINLFVLTPAPITAIELVKNPSIKINLTGGHLNRETMTLTGFNAQEHVRGLNIDLAFIGTGAFSLSNGFTCGDYYEAELKKLIIRKAQKVIVLMDKSKLNYSMPYTFARLNQINMLITDAILPEDVRRAATQSKVTIL
jgi:DeoR/GlpR family transcriptional regulator of sugar metabolism